MIVVRRARTIEIQSVAIKFADSFRELHSDICRQRKVLHPSEYDQFDFQWGLAPTGEYIRVRTVTDWFSRMFSSHLRENAFRSRTAETIIRNEMDYVQDVAKEKVEKLKYASDADISLEIMHLFVLDLLGRDTSAAKIFVSKSEEDFRHVMVVSHTTKHGFGLF